LQLTILDLVFSSSSGGFFPKIDMTIKFQEMTLQEAYLLSKEEDYREKHDYTVLRLNGTIKNFVPSQRELNAGVAE
jgi:hypothetical protein